VYGDPEIHPQPETYRGNVNPIGPRACYDEGKRCAETLFFDYFRQHKLEIKVMRIFNTYGPNMNPLDGRVVSNFIVQALKGEDITIYGDGKQTRSFCYVSDLIDGMVRLMNSEKGFTGPVNIGNPKEFTMLELAEKIIELTESKSKLIFHDLPEDDPMQRQPIIELAKNKLGWEPKIQVEEGLKTTIEYFRNLGSQNKD
jgi:UDP-glucuronate decarboxylase